jgi:hypothetical protein
MMNQFDGDQKKSEGQSQSSGAAARHSAAWVKPTVERIVWVKPTVERIALRDALTAGSTNNVTDTGNIYS